MGRSYTPTYRTEWDDRSNGVWRKEYGKPTLANLEKHVHEYAESLKAGGINNHISLALGYIPFPRVARIVRQRDGKIMAEWRAATFQAW